MWVFIPIGITAFLFFPRKAKSGTGTTTLAKELFGPFQFFGPMIQSSVDNVAWGQLRNSLIQKEGKRNTAYLDSLGKLTVGVGHLVLPSDNIVLGQTISDERVEQLFKQDMTEAFNAARKQAKELGKYTPEFIVALTHVNFQLGVYWNTAKFPNVYNDLKKDNVQSAINRLKQSKWYEQTPIRVTAFINAIQQTYA